MQVPQPGASGRRHVNESDYEEIGPPHTAMSHTAIASTNNVSASHHRGLTASASTSDVMTQQQQRPSNATETNAVCDLCGTATAIVKCSACSEQMFCLACDDMYHRHPKRSTHVRKAIGESPIKPPLPPKGETGFNAPVAPPRKNIRKGSAPDSPVTSRTPAPGLTRSSTLPRKVGSMVGRPLPPPPPTMIESKTAERNSGPPPPALPAKNPQQPPPPIPPTSSSQFYPNSLNRKMSANSQPPMHLNFPPKPMMNQLTQPEIPMPAAYPPGAMPNPAMMLMMQQQQQQQQQQPLTHFQNAFQGTEMGYPVPTHQRTPAQGAEMTWKNTPNPYIEEMQFPTAQSMANFGRAEDSNQRAGGTGQQRRLGIVISYKNLLFAQNYFN